MGFLRGYSRSWGRTTAKGPKAVGGNGGGAPATGAELFRLSASSLVGTVADSAAMTDDKWNDLIGGINGKVLGSGAPTFLEAGLDGLPCVNFTTISHYMQWTFGAEIVAPWTEIQLIDLTGADLGGRTWSDGIDSIKRKSFFCSSGQNWSVGNHLISGTIISDSNWLVGRHVVAIEWNGAETKVDLDGVNVSTENLVSLTNVSGLHINRNSGSGGGTKGKLAEWVGLDGVDADNKSEWVNYYMSL